MVIRFQLPASSLRPFVQHYLLMHVRYEGGDPAHAVKPMPPTPHHCLYFYPRDALHTLAPGQTSPHRMPPSFVVGPQVKPVALQFGLDHLLLCVVFWPGGLHRLLDVPVKELLDVAVEGRALLGSLVGEVETRLAELTDYDTMLATIEAFLLGAQRRRRARPERPLDHLLPVLLPTGRATHPLEHLAAEACLSPRQFERSFIERVGLSPKLFARLVRFDQAYRLKASQPTLDWLTVAVRSGYYDYRHLLRDFHEFAGMTPPRLLAADQAYVHFAGGDARIGGP
ncbi:helix-turn-helix domain-containing protein [Hymenobacter sp.]|jgi:AraC-like DNA-binding protein|uniref:AraC family transcriptional regulator n=1 Tax=Hymenobacter sp. TaxID=1898978 RepID=UPI002EDAD245